VQMYATRTGEIKEGRTYIRTTDDKAWFRDYVNDQGERCANDHEVTLAQIWKDDGDTSRGIVYVSPIHAVMLARATLISAPCPC